MRLRLRICSISVLFFLVSFCVLWSQDMKKPWFVDIGSNVVDMTCLSDPKIGFKDYITFKDLDHYTSILNRIEVGRYLVYGLSLSGSISINNYKKGPHWESPSDIIHTFDYKLYTGEALLRYDLSTLISEDGWFRPFLSTGAGYLKIYKRNGWMWNFGLGMRFDIAKNVSFVIQTRYNKNMSFKTLREGEEFYFKHTDFFQHAASLSFRFGKPIEQPKDRDGDGVKDKDDECPDEAGDQANGCPLDTDGDGVPDKKDKCPEEKGEGVDGCPIKKKRVKLYKNGDVYDEESIVVHDGEVYESKESISSSESFDESKWDSLPITSLDAFSDKSSYDVDDIIRHEGKIYMNKSSISTPEETRPFDSSEWILLSKVDDEESDKESDKESGEAIERESAEGSKGLVPLSSVLSESEKNLLKTKIFFRLNMSTISSKSKQGKTLDKVASVLLSHKEVRMKIKGHSCDMGTHSMKKYVSKVRAEAVRDYLIKKGIDSSRLHTKWFDDSGSNRDNELNSDKYRNRRVDLSIDTE